MARLRGSSLIVAPAHLVRQWHQELTAQGAEAQVATFEALGALGVGAARRLVIDEPQEAPLGAWQELQRLADDFREAGAMRSPSHGLIHMVLYMILYMIYIV